jgi:hypothetical protein
MNCPASHEGRRRRRRRTTTRRRRQGGERVGDIYLYVYILVFLTLLL